MAVKQQSFAAQISDWVRRVEARATAVFRESAQDVIEEMQSRVPIDTGFLKSSMQVTKDTPVPMSRPAPSEGAFTYNPSAAVLAIAGAEIGDKIFASYSANYAAHQNYGTSNMQGRHFVDLAAQRWPQIVAANCAKLQSASGAGGGLAAPQLVE